MNFVVPQVCCELLVQRAWRVVSDTHVSLCTLAIAQDLDTLPPPEEEDLPPDVGNDVVVTHRTRCLTSGKEEVATALFPVTRKVIKKLGIQPYNIAELRVVPKVQRPWAPSALIHGSLLPTKVVPRVPEVGALRGHFSGPFNSLESVTASTCQHAQAVGRHLKAPCCWCHRRASLSPRSSVPTATGVILT